MKHLNSLVFQMMSFLCILLLCIVQIEGLECVDHECGFYEEVARVLATVGCVAKIVPSDGHFATQLVIDPQPWSKWDYEERMSKLENLFFSLRVARVARDKCNHQKEDIIRQFKTLPVENAEQGEYTSVIRIPKTINRNVHYCAEILLEAKNLGFRVEMYNSVVRLVAPSSFSIHKLKHDELCE